MLMVMMPDQVGLWSCFLIQPERNSWPIQVQPFHQLIASPHGDTFTEYDNSDADDDDDADDVDKDHDDDDDAQLTTTCFNLW